MLQITKLVSIILLLTITPLAGAQESSANSLPSVQRYEGSPDLPNGIAFYMTLLSLDHSSTQFGPADPAYQVEQKLGLNKIDSHTFVSRALYTLYLINTDARAQKARLACEYAEPDVSKEDKYAALQQMYDIEKAVYDHYYDQTKASLNVEAGERLQQWMDDRKLNIGHTEFDFEKADQQSGRDSTVTLLRLCGRGD